MANPVKHRKQATHKVLEVLKDYESRNVTYMAPSGNWPLVWEKAKGLHVWDVEGQRYLDLTAAFGVAAAGHANPRVIRAARHQMGRLLHGMGDVHPHPLKAELVRALSRITFERWSEPGIVASGRRRQKRPKHVRGKTLLANSGFEAVEVALKTACLATGRPGVVAFEGGYHGLGYGALNTTHRKMFRKPFVSQLRAFGHFVPFPRTDVDLDRLAQRMQSLCSRHQIGAVLIEPVQGRAGIRIPPEGLLPWLRSFCQERGILLIVDEVYTGFGRTGAWFACEHTAVIPDLICLGKALTGGFPLSACVGRSDVMDAAWPRSEGEAIHTSTYLGHPVGCAMALAQINELTSRRLVERCAKMGRRLVETLLMLPAVRHGGRVKVRGQGLMIGMELTRQDGSPATQKALRLVESMLRQGVIVLPEGESGNVIALTPPLTVGWSDCQQAVDAIQTALTEIGY